MFGIARHLRNSAYFWKVVKIQKKGHYFRQKMLGWPIWHYINNFTPVRQGLNSPPPHKSGHKIQTIVCAVNWTEWNKWGCKRGLMTLNMEQDDDDRTAAAKKLHVSWTGQQDYSSVNLRSQIPAENAQCLLTRQRKNSVTTVCEESQFHTEQTHLRMTNFRVQLIDVFQTFISDLLLVNHSRSTN